MKAAEQHAAQDPAQSSKAADESTKKQKKGKAKGKEKETAATEDSSKSQAVPVFTSWKQV